MERLSVWPALKRTVFDALIRMASPVRGLRPLRAGRLVTPNDPKPISWTFWFFFSDAVIVATRPSSVRLAAPLLQPAVSRITEMRWSLSLTPAGVGTGRFDDAFFAVDRFAGARRGADLALVVRRAGLRAMTCSPLRFVLCR